jgi:hypothetical protein
MAGVSTDYMGRNLQTAPDRAASTAPAASSKGERVKGRFEEEFLGVLHLDHRHSDRDFRCSAVDLHAARNMWVPRMTPLLKAKAETHPYAQVSEILSIQSATTRARRYKTLCAGKSSDVKTSTRTSALSQTFAPCEVKVNARKAPAEFFFSRPMDGCNTPDCCLASSVLSPVGPADV